MQRILLKLPWVQIISVFIIVFFVLIILYMTEGNFTYILDDPYIHLKLTKNLVQGHYGINISEYSAPSSSIIWPFLLLPFTLLGRYFEYAPLLINSVCVLASAALLEKFFNFLSLSARICWVIFFMLLYNIYGVIFTGLEHSLQILLVIFIVYCIFYPDFTKQKNKQFALFFAIFLLPLVRYEGMAISCFALFYFYHENYKKQVIICFLALITALAGFSAFLYSHQLGLLPSSVVAKTAFGIKAVSLTPILWIFSLGIKSLNNFKVVYPLYIASVFLFVILKKQYKKLAYGVLITSLLHLLFGRAEFGRYEAYQMVFVAMVGLMIILNPKYSNIHKLIKYQKTYLCIMVYICLPCALFLYLILTPFASRGIYNQQAQMAIITQILNDKVAVNDLGLVSLRSQNYVLDLFGLGSIEVLKKRLSNPNEAEWLSDIVTKYNVDYIMIYDIWFPIRPKEWIKVADLSLKNYVFTTVASDKVAFYATNTQSANKMRTVLQNFSKNYPSKYRAFEFTNKKTFE